MNSVTHNQLRRNKARQDFAQFSTLIATPGDLVAGITLPANADLYVSSSAVFNGVSPYVTVKGKTISGDNGPAGTANMVHSIAHAEEQSVVTKDAAAQGTVSLYVRGGLGDLHLIGQG